MSTPAALMASDPNAGIIRRVIELRVAYEKVCGAVPTCLYVGDLMAEILLGRGLKAGMQVAGLKLIHYPKLPENEALCSRDEHLFTAAAAPRVKAKK